MQNEQHKPHSENTDNDLGATHLPTGRRLTVQELRETVDRQHEQNRSASLHQALTVDDERKPEAHIHTTRFGGQTPSNVRQLYAIIDEVTNSILGGIQIHVNDASAIRTLYDIACGDTMVNKHPTDFGLYRLGALGNNNQLNPHFERIIAPTQIETIVKAFTESKIK